MTTGFQKRCLPPGPAACADLSAREIAMVGRMQGVSSAGLEARLYGRQDACRYFGCGSAAPRKIPASAPREFPGAIARRIGAANEGRLNLGPPFPARRVRRKKPRRPFAHGGSGPLLQSRWC